MERTIGIVPSRSRADAAGECSGACAGLVGLVYGRRFSLRRRFLSLGLIAPALFSSACWVPKETGRVMQRDLGLLRADLQATQKSFDSQQARLEEQLTRADGQSKAIEEKMRQLDRAARKTDAGFGVQIEDLRRELQEQRGTIELLSYKVQQLEVRLGEPDSSATDLPGAQSAASQPVATQVPKDKKGQLAFAKQLAAKGRKAEARGVLRDLVKKHPKETGITDDAFFQLGELYYKEKKFDRALQEYIKVVEKFPRGKFVADGYYRIGLCSMELGNLEDAKIFFEEVVKKHKRSPLAKHAKAKSKEVSRRLAKEKKRKK